MASLKMTSKALNEVIRLEGDSDTASYSYSSSDGEAASDAPSATSPGASGGGLVTGKDDVPTPHKRGIGHVHDQHYSPSACMHYAETHIRKSKKNVRNFQFFLMYHYLHLFFFVQKRKKKKKKKKKKI